MRRLVLALIVLLATLSSAAAQNPPAGSVWNGQASGGPIWTINPTVAGTLSANGLALTLGGDATGDLYYRNSGGTFARLGIGSSGNLLTVSGGLPAWRSFSAACTAATSSVLGCVQGDGATLSISGPGVISINLANANTWTNTVTISPPSGTLTQGLVTSQTFPTCGVGCPQTAQLSGNIFTIVNPGWYVNNGNNTTLDTWGLSPMDAGVRINYSAQGGVSYSIHTGLAVSAVDSATANQLIGTLSAVYMNVNTSGVDAGWGIIGSSVVGASANVSTVHSVEAELFVHPSATLSIRTAFSAIAGGAGSGSLIDSVLYVSQAGPVATGYGNGASFGDLILLDNGGPNPAISTTGSLIASRGGSSTIANLIELPSYTITGDIINVPHLHVTGAGAGTSSGPNFPTPVWSFATNAGTSGAVLVDASTNQNPGFNGLQISDSQTKANISIGVWEQSDTGTLFGQTRGLFTGAVQFDASAAGELIGTTISAPLILGTNNTARLTISGAGVSTFSSSLLVATSLAIGNTANTIASGVQLQLSGQAGVASHAPLFTGTVAQIVSPNQSGSAFNGFEFDNYANGVGTGSTSNFILGMAIGGTLASPSATTSGEYAWVIGAGGYDGTSYSGTGAQIVYKATAAWTGSTHEMALIFNATPSGAIGNSTYMSIGGTFTVALYNIAAGAGSGSLCGVNNMTGNTGGAITYDNGANCIVSLREAKTDIKPLGDVLPEVMRFVPVEFRYRAGYGDDGRHEQVGLIAQDVEAVDPRCAAYDSNNKLEGVRYIQCIAVAFRAIQELKAENDNMSAELHRLRARR